MKVAVISDVHLGDESTKMVKGGKTTSSYSKLRKTAEKFTGGQPLDFLVLAGDILDFSMAPFEDALKTARPFFEALAADGVAEQLIYIPGNHDKHVWDAVEWDVRVIRRLCSRPPKEPEGFRRTQPGVLDLTGASDPPLTLPDVDFVEGTQRYGTLFLEGLFGGGATLPINVVYPNLYVKTDAGTILITHGHMLEPAWVLLSELLYGMPELRGKLGVHELEEYNVPVTSMICTGVGQGGEVSKLFCKIATEAKKGDSATLRRVIDTARPRVDSMIDLPWMLEFLDNAALSALRRLAIHAAESYRGARYDKEFVDQHTVLSRFTRFFTASCAEITSLDAGLTPPTRMIFGHTHEPINAKAPLRVPGLSDLGGQVAELYNTGGWLRAPGKAAEAFFLTESAVTSTTIT